VRLVATFSQAARTPRGIAGLIVGLAGVGLAIFAAFSGPAANATSAGGMRAARPTQVVVRGLPVPAGVVARLDAIALRAAKASGDPRPDWITVVRTTHGKALESATPGDTEPVGNNIAVYLITMKGSFTTNVPTPSGAAAPTGTYLSLVVSARSFSGLDFGLSKNPPAVSPASLGPVRRLAL
jgi:hypothetical protein